MSSRPDPRPLLSAENLDRLRQALHLSQTLQGPTHDANTQLVELRMLLDRCREGIRRQKPNHREGRLAAVDQARNYLHFLPDMQHAQAAGRLKSVSRRLERAMRA